MSRKVSCVRCDLSHSGPPAFLLTCSECRRAWHHRCHVPPVEDAELIQRIRATTEHDIDNGLEKWVCKRCKKNKGKVPAQREMSSSSSGQTSVTMVASERSASMQSLKYPEPDAPDEPSSVVAAPEKVLASKPTLQAQFSSIRLSSSVPSTPSLPRSTSYKSIHEPDRATLPHPYPSDIARPSPGPGSDQ
ncbi:hypothetical protein SERLADRAFT_470519 [Serpula lacrymans var. lacrymans S7.9]|uniref:PHD-type domain-containing protein n=1 Tax=Serpula lacrymans var. lacrymans (strain S7.9) TaxID=578457 RepID=F8NZE5_SERL9|nr:uncharacterized protein SERLADRAFT_470519 [Serpula lacrymans var. lacrymans S7.9]EGO23965.1 hypothetical protein SERLADRAFT_470519 [Serpula lacrymans var. lacrymans S7.9]